MLALLPAESYVEYQLARAEAAAGVVRGGGRLRRVRPGVHPDERAWKENDANLGDWCWVNPGSEKRMEEALRKVIVD